MIADRISLAALAALVLSVGSCGGDSKAAAGRKADEIEACTLLTSADIESAAGVVPGVAERPHAGLNSCQWPHPTSPVPVAYIGLSYGNAKTWEEYRAYMIENDYGDPEESGERVELGLFAHYQPDASSIQVWTDDGSLITLNVPGADKSRIVELANKALARTDS